MFFIQNSETEKIDVAESSFSFTTQEISGIGEFVIANTNGFYEANADDGSFSETITISLFSLLGNIDISNAHQTSVNVFGTDLQDRPVDTTVPVGISGLADGLSIRLSTDTNTAGKVTTLKVNLIGTATDHEGRVNNSTFTLTFGSNLFEVDEAVFATEDISFTFDLNFIIPRWSARDNHEAFGYDDKLWVLGGDDGGGRTNDIWWSANGGMSWSKVTVEETHWSSRELHQAFAYDRKLWVLGGLDGSKKNDIWMSSNGGVNWSQVTVNGTYWSARYSHQAFAYESKLWVLGGFASNFKNDIWWSANGGVSWSNVTVEGQNWPTRYSHQAFGYDSKLWVLGGQTDILIYKNDIWMSTNGGTNWILTAIDGGGHWTRRANYRAFGYDSKLWVLGGQHLDSDRVIRIENDIWMSSDEGINWSKVTVNGIHWTGRRGHKAFAYDNKLWVLGGWSGGSKKNDIWWSADGGINWTEVEVLRY